VAGPAGDTIFVLETGHSIEFDWTWEGAVAFRPANPNEFAGDVDATDDFPNLGSGDTATDSQHAVWSGEIVEIDETNGMLFVSISNPDHSPCVGTFFVRPFEFMAFLHSAFCKPDGDDFRKLLGARLAASRGDIHPAVAERTSSGLKELDQLWSHSWAILWGPPGTGKTHTIGRQVAGCLNNWAERILVVSTTNRATDAAALAIGRAGLTTAPDSVKEGRILRIGQGADWADYQSQGLEALLRGTETQLLRQVAALTREVEKAKTPEDRAFLRYQIQELRRSMKDSAFNIFLSAEVQAVVTTAFKAITLLNHPSIRAMVAAGESPFTTVVIDEAGLMCTAIVSALSLLAARRLLVVGDGKQLAPISKISRILPTAQAIWLANSCVNHLQGARQVKPGIHLLREQHRMHPHVSRVVSHKYDGALQDGRGVSTRLAGIPRLLDGQPRAIWYVLDEDCHDLPLIRAERGPGNRSWIRSGTREVLAKLFSDTGIRQIKGLFITPFKAQARNIAAYVAEEHLEQWSAGTVHARQGTEADW
jgi:hypothetical protein